MQHRIRRISQGFISGFRIVRYAFERLGEERGAEAAAGMAFYSFFSLFPLLLILAVFGGALLESAEAQTQVLKSLVQVFPFSGDYIERNIQQVLQARSSVGTLSTIALSWSGSAAFVILARNINRAWPDAAQRPFLARRLMALLILVVLMIAIAMMLSANTITRFLPPEVNGAAQILIHMRYFSNIVLWMMLFLTLLILYRWLPNMYVTWAEGAWGGLVASVAGAFATWGFARYLKSGFANYSLVYGSLSAVVILLFWIYLLGLIVLFGAHLSASIACHIRLGE